MRRLLPLLGAGTLLASALVVIAGQPAAAAPLTPTTTDDVVDAGDGQLSLREAVAQANANPGPDTIELVPGARYLLTGGCPSLDDGTPAQLVHPSTDDLTIEGHGATIEQTGTPGPWLCPARILNAGGGVTLADVTLRGGDSPDYCPSPHPACAGVPSPAGGALRAAGPLVLDRVTVVSSFSGLAGGGVSSDTSVTATDSVISGNTVQGAGGGISAPSVSLLRSTVADNRAFSHSGNIFGCFSGRGGGVAATTVDVTDSLIAHNRAAAVQMSSPPPPPNTFAPCQAPGEGGGVFATTVGIANSTITENEAEDLVGSAAAGIDPVPARGGGLSATSATLDDSTVVDNVAGGGAQLAFDELTAGASAIGGPPGSVSCSTADPQTSNGYNAVGAGTCGLGGGTGDRTHVPRFGLGVLADHGGPTDTRLPAANGALSIIPVGDCVPAADQRGQARPQGGACEAGSVEVGGAGQPTAAPPALGPHGLTGVPGGIADAVDWAVANDVIAGFADGSFRPDQAVTRGQIVSFLWRMAGAPPSTEPIPFRDVPRTAWYRPALRWAVEAELITGFPDGTFRSRLPVKRAQYVRMLYRFASEPFTRVDASFPDVPADAWYHDGLDWVVEQQLLEPVETRFRPGDPITRDVAAMSLYLTASTPSAWRGNTPPPTRNF